MALFGEFSVPSSAFALHETLAALPDATIEIERVVAVEEVLAPYFWVADVPFSEFEAAAEADPSVEDLRQLDRFGGTALYRARWTEDVESIVYVYTEIDGVVLDATGTRSRWTLQIRFDDREQLGRFRAYCRERGIAFELQQLSELSYPRTGERYGLTPKQLEALVMAWEMGYFELPRRATLGAIAGTLDISAQSLSQRLRRGHQSLIAETLVDPAESRTDRSAES